MTQLCINTYAHVFESSRSLARAILTLCLWYCASSWAAAAPQAWLDRNDVALGDSVTLTLQLTDALTAAEPDLAPLAADFTLRGTQTSHQLSIVNGQRRASVNWQVELLPKRSGTLTIPPLPLGAGHTPVLTLAVRPAAAAVPPSAPGDELFIEVEFDTAGQPLLVQQQVPLVVRLYSTRPLRGGDLSEPHVDGAMIERLGRDQQLTTQRAGKTYLVIERRYSLSPERSGQLRLDPIIFDGEVQTAAPSRRSLFNDPTLDDLLRGDITALTTRGTPVRVQSAPLVFTVQAQQAQAAHWLPAEELTINDSWAQQPPALTVGEPATRMLTLTAKGLEGSQIPQLDMPVPAGVRTYPEPPRHETRTDGTRVFGTSEQRLTLIPTSGGPLVLPTIRVPWWDTQTQRERVIIIPALRLSVSGAVSTSPASTPPAVAAPVPASTATAAVPVPAAAPATVAVPIAPTTLFTLIGIVAAVLLIAAGARQLSRWLRERYRRLVTIATWRQAVLTAAARHDATATGRALLGWAQACCPAVPLPHLHALLTHLAGAPARQQHLLAAVRQLHRALYAPTSITWHGAAMQRALPRYCIGIRCQLPQTATVPTDRLAPLYPQRSQ